MESEDELFFSFIQCGQDVKATQFLDSLDAGLGAKYDIVDTLQSPAFQGRNFVRAIQGLLPLVVPQVPVMVTPTIPKEFGLRFFQFISSMLAYNYVIVLDVGGSLHSGAQSLWQEVEAAVKLIVPAVYLASPEGATLYVFSDGWVVFQNRQSVAEVEQLFQQHNPSGQSHLHPVLMAVIAEHRRLYTVQQQPTSVLILHDKEPHEVAIVWRPGWGMQILLSSPRQCQSHTFSCWPCLMIGSHFVVSADCGPFLPPFPVLGWMACSGAWGALFSDDSGPSEWATHIPRWAQLKLSCPPHFVGPLCNLGGEDPGLRCPKRSDPIHCIGGPPVGTVATWAIVMELGDDPHPTSIHLTLPSWGHHTFQNGAICGQHGMLRCCFAQYDTCLAVCQPF